MLVLNKKKIFTIFPDMADEWILTGLKILNNILVEGIHVLHQPLLRRVVHVPGVVDDAEIGLVLNKVFVKILLGKYRLFQ